MMVNMEDVIDHEYQDEDLVPVVTVSAMLELNNEWVFRLAKRWGIIEYRVIGNQRRAFIKSKDIERIRNRPGKRKKKK